jgi:hypothetical protein
VTTEQAPDIAEDEPDGSVAGAGGAAGQPSVMVQDHT